MRTAQCAMRNVQCAMRNVQCAEEWTVCNQTVCGFLYDTRVDADARRQRRNIRLCS